MLMDTMIRKFLSESLTNWLSRIPNPKPKPRMGAITGEMSMAPMMTGIELTLSPTEAIMMAQARINTLAPRKCIPLRMDTLAPSRSRSSDMLTNRNSLNLKLLFAIVLMVIHNTLQKTQKRGKNCITSFFFNVQILSLGAILLSEDSKKMQPP